MSHTEDNTDQTQEQEASSPASEGTAEELRIVEAMKPSSAPSASKPLRYGTRRGRPGAKTPAPAVKISSISPIEEEEEIEMDDLPVKATAPEHLIDKRSNPSDYRETEGDERPRRENRSRGERRRPSRRERSPEDYEERTPRRAYREPASARVEDTADEKTAADEPANADVSRAAASEEDRPPRFGVVNEAERAARAQKSVQEFRPSRDGRTSDRRIDAGRGSRRPSAPQKKGFLSKVIAFFTGGSTSEETTPPQSKAPSAKRPRRDGPRTAEGGSGSPDDRPKRKRRPRNRNRKPREGGERTERRSDGSRSEGDDGSSRRRRRPRKRGQRRGDGDSRPTRDRQESSPSA